MFAGASAFNCPIVTWNTVAVTNMQVCARPCTAPRGASQSRHALAPPCTRAESPQPLPTARRSSCSSALLLSASPCQPGTRARSRTCKCAPSLGGTRGQSVAPCAAPPLSHTESLPLPPIARRHRTCSETLLLSTGPASGTRPRSRIWECVLALAWCHAVRANPAMIWRPHAHAPSRPHRPQPPVAAAHVRGRFCFQLPHCDLEHRRCHEHASLCSAFAQHHAARASPAMLFAPPTLTHRVALTAPSQQMFNSASAFNQALSTWDTSAVTNMGVRACLAWCHPVPHVPARSSKTPRARARARRVNPTTRIACRRRACSIVLFLSTSHWQTGRRARSTTCKCVRDHARCHPAPASSSTLR